MTTSALSDQLRELFDRWDSDFPTLCAAFEAAFAPGCLWENAGMPAVRGYAEAYEKILVPSNAEPIGMDAMHVEVLSMLQSGNTVISERIDHVLRADGSVVASIAIAGFVEFDENGLITHWRDYCDPTPLHELERAARAG